MQLRRHRIDLRQHQGGGLAVVVDSRRFGSARVAVAVDQGDGDQGQVVHHLAGDLEGLAQRPALNRHLDTQGHAIKASAMASTPPLMGSHTGSPSSPATAWR